MHIYIEKSGDLIVCHHSGTNEQTMNKERWGYSVIGPKKAWMSNKTNMVDGISLKISSKTFRRIVFGSKTLPSKNL